MLGHRLGRRHELEGGLQGGFIDFFSGGYHRAVGVWLGKKSFL
jgi:hypothetical protein